MVESGPNLQWLIIVHTKILNNILCSEQDLRRYSQLLVCLQVHFEIEKFGACDIICDSTCDAAKNYLTSLCQNVNNIMN